MKDFLQNLPFRTALILVGALFFILGLSGGITLGSYSATIQGTWERFTLSISGAILIIVALFLEVKTNSMRHSIDGKPVPTQTADVPVDKASFDSALLVRSLSDTYRSLDRGAILYLVAEASNDGRNENLIDSVRKHVGELSEALHPANASSSAYHYWYKQGYDHLSVLIEPQGNEGAPKVMTHAFLLTLILLRRLQVEVSGNHTDVSAALHAVKDVKLSQHGEFSDYWGPSLDVARHLAEGANDHQFIISKAAFDHLDRVFAGAKQGLCRNLLHHMRGSIPSKLEMEARWLEEPFAFNVQQWTFSNQYFRKETIYGFTISEGTEVIIGSSTSPPDWIQLEHRDPLQPQNPVQRFVKHLTEADEVCIVGMTHENTAEYLNTAFKARKEKFWKNIQVVFPSEQTLREVKEVNRSFDERKKKWEDSKKQLIIFFESKGAEYLDNWSCIECDENFSFWGNRLVIGDQRRIRIAPLIQGADLKNMPYMTFSEGMDGYSLLSEAFDVILASGHSIVEWDLFGKLMDDQFIYQGIANHARLNAFPEYWKPVTLVILHTHEIDQHKILLQKRSIFNAVDQYNTYSNISGRICVSDIARPESVQEFYRKVNKREEYPALNPRQESSLATDIFHDIAGFKPAVVITDDAWVNAAIREVREELGLTINKSDLCAQAAYNLTEHNLCFRIYSLEISTRQLQEIHKHRPHVGLEAFGRAQLIAFHQKMLLNRLLQNKFDEVFLPIFDTLQISV